MSRVILDLCGGTGSWAAPYKEAGYDVRLISLPQDVRLYSKPEDQIHGILAAPPCTEFSFAKHYHGKGNYSHNFLEGLSISDACLRLVVLCRPVWWAMENPRGYMRRFYGPPVVSFDPWQYGDPYQKKTDLWGSFTVPNPSVLVRPDGLMKFSLLKSRDIRPEVFGKYTRTERRAMTPDGFAKAFFEVNQ